MLHYLTNIYVIPFIATIIGLAIIYLYDKFEKKQYPLKIYIRLGLVFYISTYCAIYISRLESLHSFNLLSSLQSGGGSTQSSSSSSLPDTSSFNTGEFSRHHMEHFKTGVPTF